jgi:hypothetical protein
MGVNGGYYRENSLRGANLSEVAKLLPTPTTMDHMAPKTDKAILKEMTITRPGRTQLSNLRDVVVRQPEKLLPTPTVMDTGGKQDLDQIQARREKAKAKGINGNGFGMQLQEQSRRGMLPTPNASDNRDRGNMNDPSIQRRIKMGKQIGLTVIMKSVTSEASQLNPQFVSEMMGFPPNWTELPFLTGSKNP